MCGIGGIITSKRSDNSEEQIKSFTEIISHRGPDDEGYYVYENVMLGHRRLSILDLSTSGHQPMHYDHNNYTLIYNGEIYNYIELRDELKSAGYKFSTNTDTEVILAAYDYWGDTCVEHFNGMWAFALLDKKENIIFCSRDRFGIKPFYYLKTDKLFAFGSEIKQFTTLSDWCAEINIARAIDFISYGLFDHTDETLFKGVKQLRGGNNLYYSLDSHEFTIKEWYNLTHRVKKYKNDFKSASHAFKTLFTDAVALRLRSDVKVGSCLSGGLDSTSIVCTVNKILRKEGKHEIQETVTSCSKESKYDEQNFADEVINFTSVKAHKVFPQLDTLFEKLDELVWHQDEPFSSSSIFAQWCVFEEAKKQNLIVMLDGQGADESLAGYPPFHDAYQAALLKGLRLSDIFKESKALQNLKGYGLIKRWQFLAKLVLPKNIINNLSANSEKFLSASAKKAKNRHEPYFLHSIRDMSLDQLLKSNLPMLLHYEDRNSMAHSIESRVPFLDYRLVEFILGLPDDFKINKGQTKRILRDALSETIPINIKNRHDKMGFVTPESVWLKRNSVEVEKYLDAAVKDMQELLDKDMVKKQFKSLISNDNDIQIGSVFFRILTFHKWMKRFNAKFEIC